MIRKKDRITLEKLKELAEVHGKRIFIHAEPACEEVGEDPPQPGDVAFEVVYKPPSRQHWLSFKRDQNSSVTDIKMQATEGYAKSCVVYVHGAPESVAPTLALDALLQDNPAAADAASIQITKRAGFDVTNDEK